MTTKLKDYTPEDRLRAVFSMAGALYEEHRRHFVTSHLDEVVALQRNLENLLDKLAQDRREYETWLDERLWGEFNELGTRE